MKLRLYLETTIPSYLTAARERWQLLQHLPLLDITAEVGALTSSFRFPELPDSRNVRRRAATDAGHIAVAAVHGMDLLVTWNCVHIANAVIVRTLASICREHECQCPVICTPEELPGE